MSFTTRTLRRQGAPRNTYLRHLGLLLGACAFGFAGAGSTTRANSPSADTAATFRQYCFGCHSTGAGMGGINLAQMTAKFSAADDFQKWRKVVAVLEQKRMPPAKMPHPAEAQTAQAVTWIRGALNAYATKHDGDPGRVTVRRLTTGEYAYSVEDLTGLDLNVEHDLASDEVGGEGFTNFGDVQFMQDANMERYLEVAKNVADHAVIGAGPIGFFADAGKTGFELSAIDRIQAIYHANGFRTVSGEGGRPFGLERYGKALYAAWRYQHRAALGEPNVTIKDLAAREGIPPRFAEHIWAVLQDSSLSYPSSEVASRWRTLPSPGAGKNEEAIRAACTEVQQFLVTWPSWLFARGDVAAGGAGDERPLEFSDASLAVKARRNFRFFRGARPGRGPALPTGGTARIYLNAVLANPNHNGKPLVIWRNPTVQFRTSPGRPDSTETTATQGATEKVAAGQVTARRFARKETAPRLPLRSVVTEESAQQLAFGKSLDGSQMSADDFASPGSVSFDVQVPDGQSVFELQVDAEVGTDRDQVLRITMSDQADGSTRGVPVWGLVGDPQSDGYRAWKAGVMQYATVLPPNSHGEPTPADKDPIPEPFDNTYNVPEHDDFVVKVKYIRDDKFVVDYILDAATRKRLDDAWSDLYASFDYHDAYLRLLAQKFKLDLTGRNMAQLDGAQMEALPAEPRKYIKPLRAHYEQVMAAQAAGQPQHMDDCLRFASQAWRRPLTAREKFRVRAFYKDLRQGAKMEHSRAIRAVLARILVSPAFIYRLEPAAQQAAVRPLTDWEMASRLSYLLWSSIPDGELRRAAAAGELHTPPQLRAQVKRMLADPKARRMSTEFFGQWLGFYRFDQHRGVDSSRFPEFTAEVKTAMYDEAVSFFEHIVRKDRPVGEILDADYTFLNQALAKHYGIGKKIESKDRVEIVQGANEFHRGGALRLGAVLTATSAPLRTSPVKRGDWVLRRILGTPTPPPPADAGSIPADDKLFGGLSLREKLKAHQRNATCAGCHSRIDPLGFPLERYDPVGRWRTQYSDGKPIHDSTETADKTEIAGADGLIKYIAGHQDQFLGTFSHKLLGYALGRTVLASDQLLIDRMTKAGSSATFSSFVEEIVTSRQFRYRREPAPAQQQQIAAAPRGTKSTTVGTP